MSTLTTTILFGPTAAALRYAESIRRALPPMNRAQAEAMRGVFETVLGSPLSDPTSLNEPALRHPHFTACFAGIFGGGATNFPGEFALARHGVLLFADAEHFKPEIATALAEKLQNPMSEGFPIVLIHAARAADFPQSLAALSFPRVQIG